VSEEYSIDPVIWFAERQLTFPLKHFTPTHSPVTVESREWILNHVHGRFSIASSASLGIPNPNWDIDYYEYAFFEDSQDALFYELKWSS
jgi:hypothetical protein